MITEEVRTPELRRLETCAEELISFLRHLQGQIDELRYEVREDRERRRR